MKGFKTILYGLLIAVTAVLADESVKAFVLENFEAIGASLGAGVMILRAITSSPIFKK